MSCFRCYLVPTLLLLPVIFVCGKLLLTQVKSSHDSEGILAVDEQLLNDRWLYGAQAYSRGWPWVFDRTIDALPSISTQVRQFVRVYFSWSILTADIAILLLALAQLSDSSAGIGAEKSVYDFRCAHCSSSSPWLALRLAGWPESMTGGNENKRFESDWRKNKSCSRCPHTMVRSGCGDYGPRIN